MSRKRRSAAEEPYLVARTSVADVRAGSRIGDHAHDWHQLIHISTGLMTVSTTSGSWVAPPSRAIWVPAGVRHGIRFVGESALRTLYVRPGWRDDLPAGCAIVTITPLLRELILRATRIGMLDRRVSVEAALALLIAAELDQIDIPPFTLPQPTSPTLRDAAQRIADCTSIAELARSAGMSLRTFERRFLSETGVTPGVWRQQQALLGGLERLAGGASVKSVAADSGYSSPSAFIAAFRASFGTTPGRYFA